MLSNPLWSIYIACMARSVSKSLPHVSSVRHGAEAPRVEPHERTETESLGLSLGGRITHEGFTHRVTQRTHRTALERSTAQHSTDLATGQMRSVVGDPPP